MEASSKKPYKAPSSETVSIRTFGVLCESPNASGQGTLQDYTKQVYFEE